MMEDVAMSTGLWSRLFWSELVHRNVLKFQVHHPR
jgi:hypothetical protein